MPALELDNRQLRQLRRLAHALKPVVRIGQHGLNTGVRRELDIALSHHELIKIKLPGERKEARLAMIDSLLGDVGATLIQQTGHTAVLFRRNRQQPVIVFDQ